MAASKHIETINKEQVDRLLKFNEPKLYQVQQELIYEGQVPHVGFLLIEGEIRFLKRKKIQSVLEPGHLFGVTELMEHSPLKYTVQITPGTKVIILDRSTVKEILEQSKASELPQSFAKIV